MSQSNPHFTHAERASYEFGYLLRSLPSHLVGPQPLTKEECLMVEAADNHAMNYSDTLLFGLEALGRVVWAAGVNEKNQVELCDLANVGMLVSELAIQLQLLKEFRSEAAEHTLRHAQKGARK